MIAIVTASADITSDGAGVADTEKNVVKEADVTEATDVVSTGREEVDFTDAVGIIGTERNVCQRGRCYRCC